MSNKVILIIPMLSLFKYIYSYIYEKLLVFLIVSLKYFTKRIKSKAKFYLTFELLKQAKKKLLHKRSISMENV